MYLKDLLVDFWYKCLAFIMIIDVRIITCTLPPGYEDGLVSNNWSDLLQNALDYVYCILYILWWNDILFAWLIVNVTNNQIQH